MWNQAYQKSSRSSFTVAWKGMFRTRILEVVCFLAVCFFLLGSATPDLHKQQKENGFHLYMWLMPFIMPVIDIISQKD